jgi:hypothetical protein
VTQKGPTYRWNPAVATRTLDGTAFVLVHSRMVSLNDAGTRIWALCQGGATVDSVAQLLTSEYDVDLGRATGDAHSFLETLRERGMLVRD